MAVLLFKLNGVPQDEAEEVRELLDRHKIDYYETSAGNWGVSLAALWLKDKQQYKHAKEILSEYSENRQLTMQDRYQQQLMQGRFRFYLGELIKHPVQLLLYVAIIILVGYVSIVPFLNFGQ